MGGKRGAKKEGGSAGERLHRSESGGVAVWRLGRGRGNALDESSLQALAYTFKGAKDDPRPVVLAGGNRSFCTGLDLQEAIELNRAGMARLMRAFEQALKACYLHPAPVVAAVRGHALAGGALLALCCDRRILADRGCRFGIHGIHLGVSYPQLPIEVLRDGWPRPRCEELLYEGRIHEPEDALARGLVDRIVPPEDVEPEAIACALELASPSLAAYALAKAGLRRRVRERLARIRPAADESWLDQWFSPQTQANLSRARDALVDGEGKKPGETS